MLKDDQASAMLGEYKDVIQQHLPTVPVSSKRNRLEQRIAARGRMSALEAQQEAKAANTLKHLTNQQAKREERVRSSLL